MTPPPMMKLAEGEVNGLVGLLAVVVVLLGGHGERDASVGGDDLGELLDAEGDGGVVVTLLGKRRHGAADVADLGVVEDAFEAVTDLDAAPPGGHDEKHQDAAIVLVADLPLLFELGGELLDGLVGIDGLDGDDGDLGVGLAVHEGAEPLQTCLGVG